MMVILFLDVLDHKPMYVESFTRLTRFDLMLVLEFRSGVMLEVNLRVASPYFAELHERAVQGF